MQIIIPMSGFGERFRKAGYQVPKPLIEVEGKPIIAHVIDLFPGEKKFIFICNSEHLNEPAFRMAEILKNYCPTGQIVRIEPHKLGPVHAVRQARHLLNFNQPVIVNYCDFCCYYNWEHFKRFVADKKCAGAIPAYKGFHPHSLGNTNYAYMRETNGWVEDIQEKQPYTQNRMNEFASSGTYYFASGQLMDEAFRAVMEQNLHINGEYYVSLAYKILLAKKEKVAVYPLEYFMQWGTPEDLNEYTYWSRAFRQLIEQKNTAFQSKGSVIIPMAGLGQRFVNAGYELPKPLLPVSKMPMVVQATRDLPPSEQKVFVLRRNMPGFSEILSKLKFLYPSAIMKVLPDVSEGQACTALMGLDALESSLNTKAPSPVTFGTCDNGVLYDFTAFQKLSENPDVDVIVWGIRGYPNAIRHPEMYGWVSSEQNLISGISVKKPLGSVNSDPIVIGVFTFKRAKDYRNTVQELMSINMRINGEFYLDSCINVAVEQGLKCYLFEVDSYLSWGTPNELRTFEYWQSCFHKWRAHPYRLELDRRVPKSVKFSLVVPCYNEAENLTLLLKRCKNMTTHPDIEIIFVDNGSTDNTSEVFSQLLPHYSTFRSIRIEKNQGYGFGILAGLKAANGQILGWTHADMQTDPLDVLRGLEIFTKNGEDIFVKGNRSGRRFFDVLFTIGMSFFETFLFMRPFWDINAQPTMFSRKFFETWESPPHDFSLDLYVYYQAHKSKLRIYRFPVRFEKRAHGVSHWNVNWRAKLKFISRTIDFSLKLRKTVKK